MRISLFIGQGAELNAEQAPGLVSAIHKQAVTHPVWCGFLGLVGDEQSDQRHHGGPERALHYYPADHYPWWLTWQTALGLPAPRTPWQPAAFGENLSGLGLTEAEACIGDVFRLGDALVQISQPRSPCFKLNQRFGYAHLSQVMQLSGRCGWLLRVLEHGVVADWRRRLLGPTEFQLPTK